MHVNPSNKLSLEEMRSYLKDKKCLWLSNTPWIFCFPNEKNTFNNTKGKNQALDCFNLSEMIHCSSKTFSIFSLAIQKICYGKLKFCLRNKPSCFSECTTIVFLIPKTRFLPLEQSGII